MDRRAFYFCLAMMFAATAGCRMCCHQDDYCGPTYTRGCYQSCSPTARSGSILSDPIHGDCDTSYPCPDCQGADQLSFDGQIPAEHIISVTDEKVQADDTPQAHYVRAGVRMLQR